MWSICIQKLNTDGTSTVFYIINVWWVNWEMNYLYCISIFRQTAILCIVDWSLSSFICYCDIIWNRKIALGNLTRFSYVIECCKRFSVVYAYPTLSRLSKIKIWLFLYWTRWNAFLCRFSLIIIIEKHMTWHDKIHWPCF